MISALRRKTFGDEARKSLAVVGCRKIIDDNGLAAHVAQFAQGLEERVEAGRPRLQRARFECQEAKLRDRLRPLALADRRSGEESEDAEECEAQSR